MPIHSFEENRRMPVIGKIRLGVIKEGTTYPQDVDYFVLKDAPGVMEKYGEKPKLLDCFFISDDPEDVMPYWYKWYSGGVKDKSGNPVGGTLQCYGDGKVAHHLAKRDPATRVVPTRQCNAEKCPDWINANGKKQCGPSMSVFVLLPLVSLYGVFQIDTGSVASINNFVSVVGTIYKQYGKLKGIPFQVYRDPIKMNYTDSKGNIKSSQHAVLSIRPNEVFMQTHGKEIQAKLDSVMSSAMMPAPKQELLETSTRDYVEPEPPKVSEDMDKLADDKELGSLFAEVATLKNRSNTHKDRLLAVRCYEKDEKPKEKIQAYLTKMLTELKAKKPPAANADGII